MPLYQPTESVAADTAQDGAVAAGGGAGGAYRGSAAVLDLLGGLLARVPIEAPPADEQATILAALFQELAPLVPAAMETLATVHAAGASDRRVGFHIADWLRRPTSPLQTTLDAVVCRTCSQEVVQPYQHHVDVKLVAATQCRRGSAPVYRGARGTGGCGAARRGVGAVLGSSLLAAGPHQMGTAHAGLGVQHLKHAITCHVFMTSSDVCRSFLRCVSPIGYVSSVQHLKGIVACTGIVTRYGVCRTFMGNCSTVPCEKPCQRHSWPCPYGRRLSWRWRTALWRCCPTRRWVLVLMHAVEPAEQLVKAVLQHI